MRNPFSEKVTKIEFQKLENNTIQVLSEQANRIEALGRENDRLILYFILLAIALAASLFLTFWRE